MWFIMVKGFIVVLGGNLYMDILVGLLKGLMLLSGKFFYLIWIFFKFVKLFGDNIFNGFNGEGGCVLSEFGV